MIKGYIVVLLMFSMLCVGYSWAQNSLEKTYKIKLVESVEKCYSE